MKVLDILKNKKIIFSIIIVIMFSILLIGYFNSKTNKVSSYMKDLATVFYEDNYYKQIGSNDDERKKYLENYQNIGFKMTIKGLLNYTNDKKIINYLENSKCNLEESIITIYPKSPYKKKDYKFIINLKC